MILTHMLGKMVGRFAMMLPLLRMGLKQMKMAQKQMREFAEQNQASNPYNQPGEQGQRMSKEEMKRKQADKMAAMMKSEQEHIDQMLRDQGIDIDALDEQFGTKWRNSASESKFYSRRKVIVKRVKTKTSFTK